VEASAKNIFPRFGTLNYGVVFKGAGLRQGPDAVIAVAILHCPSTVIGNIKKGKSKKHRQNIFAGKG
jgi:hypothetical protein